VSFGYQYAVDDMSLLRHLLPRGAQCA